jgi:hypothetical protein
MKALATKKLYLRKIRNRPIGGQNSTNLVTLEMTFYGMPTCL